MLSLRDQWPKVDYLLAALAGAVMVLAFAPFAFRPLAWLALAAFFWLNLKPMPRARRVWMAWAFGVGLFAAGAHWIFFSIHFFGGANTLIAVVMVTVFVLLMAFFLMVFAWLVSWFEQVSVAGRLLLVFPAAWVLTEWFRGWFLTGFPWLQIGYTQIDAWLVNYAPIAGILGVSWMVALGAGALVLLLVGTRRERLLASVLAVSTALGGWALGAIQWTHPTGEKLWVSMIQGNIPQEKKWLPEYRNVEIQKYFDATAELGNAHLIIWPETAIPDFFEQSMDDVVLPLQKEAIDANIELLVGGFHYDAEQGGIYNAILKVGKDLDYYGKQHLVPFSEYIPFLKYLRFLENYIKLPYDNVTPWHGKNTLVAAGQPMRMSVCYEDAYGEEMIQGLPKATMLVNVSNDGWFTGSIEPAQHAEIARMRSVETGRYLLRSTNNGITALINDRGKVVVTAPQYQDAVVSGYAQPMAGSTPYIRWGNWLIIPLLSAMLVGVYFRPRGKTV